MTKNHRLSLADIITMFRIMGAVSLLDFRPFSSAFFCVYALTGLSDVLDGLIARKTHTESEFGARLERKTKSREQKEAEKNFASNKNSKRKKKRRKGIDRLWTISLK